MEDYSTCEISDALIKLGIPHGGYLPDIHCVSPSADSGVRIEGPAYTVKMVKFDDQVAPKPDVHFVDAVERGCVVVIEAPSDVKSAVWGGLMTLGAQARGAVGVVISGRCRDILEHRQASFPVFCKSQSTLGQKPFTRPSALNVTLTITSSPNGSWQDVQVNPGDWVVADLDGVVTVPYSMMEKVNEVCKKGREVDELCKEDIMKGMGVAETFKKYRGT